MIRLGRDLRHAVRMIARMPALAAVVIGSLATGIGANGRAPSFTRGSAPTYRGPPLPPFNASFGNTVRYGALQFYALVTMERGAVFGNSDRPYRVRQGGADEYLQFLNSDGSTTFAADSVFNYWSLFDAVDSRDNVRLRELSLSYTLPDRFLSRTNLGRTQLTLSGQNLMWWDHCHCVDPNKDLVLNPAAWSNPAAGQWGTASAYYDDDGSYSGRRRGRSRLDQRIAGRQRRRRVRAAL